MYHVVPESVVQNVVIAIYGFIVPALVIVGLIGNVMTFFILKKEPSKTSTTYLLFALTCADTMYMVTTALSDSIIIASKIKPAEVTYFRVRYLLPLETGLWSLPSYISNWVVVMISVERAIAVLFPLKARQIWTKRTSIVAVVIACLLPTISTCTRFLKARGVPVVNNVTNEVVSYRLQLYYIPGLDRKFYSILRLINTYLLYVAPVCIVLCANICIVVGLYCSKRWFALQFSSERQKRDNRVSKMMFLICLQFCLCLIPYASIMTYNISSRDSNNQNNMYENNLVELMSKIAYVFLIWNSAMNFIVYVATSSTFRKGYVQMLCAACSWHRRKFGTIEKRKGNRATNSLSRQRFVGVATQSGDSFESSDVVTRSEFMEISIIDDVAKTSNLE